MKKKEMRKKWNGDIIVKMHAYTEHTRIRDFYETGKDCINAISVRVAFNFSEGNTSSHVIK